ncbi:uncharacterized protein METZ01_LOCUS371706 [marine metagenome]|uniref:Uncharacterized protein n=1 Tax=marine metagenome TaxID=408172 RepID=A0A382TAN6_9ZZZZ
MSILYIEEEIKKRKAKQEIIDTLESIGLTPSDIPDVESDVRKRFDEILKYQEWVKESFFQEYEINAHKIISPKFGDD